MPKQLAKKPIDRDDIEYSFDHCVQRFSERYNRILTKEKYDEYNKEIRIFIESQFTKSSIHKLELISREANLVVTTYTIKLVDDIEIYASFEKKRNRITTFFPPYSVKQKNKK